jgi:hypothetical protein
MTATFSLPSAYDLKRQIATSRAKFWLADRLAEIPDAPIYVFPDQRGFDSDEVDLMSRGVLAGPLMLPHPHVLFEVTPATAECMSVVAYARALEGGVEGFLFVRGKRQTRWSDVSCNALFLPDGAADVVAHPDLTDDAATQMYFPVLTGTVWRALGLLHARTLLHEATVSRLRRSPLVKAGVRGWNYHVATIDLPAIRALVEASNGTHAPPRWHIRRGHWRQLPDGRRTFIRECEVGDRARGGIVKDYRIDLRSAA